MTSTPAATSTTGGLTYGAIVATREPFGDLLVVQCADQGEATTLARSVPGGVVVWCDVDVMQWYAVGESHPWHGSFNVGKVIRRHEWAPDGPVVSGVRVAAPVRRSYEVEVHLIDGGFSVLVDVQGRDVAGKWVTVPREDGFELLASVVRDAVGRTFDGVIAEVVEGEPRGPVGSEVYPFVVTVEF